MLPFHKCHRFLSQYDPLRRRVYESRLYVTPYEVIPSLAREPRVSPGCAEQVESSVHLC